MDKYTIGTQIIAITILIVFLFILYHIIRSYFRVKRIKKFTLDTKTPNETAELFLLDIIKKISTTLTNLIIFNNIKHTYDKYLEYRDTKLTNIDIISIKILSTIAILILYFLSISLYKAKFSSLLATIICITVFFIPDIYLIISTKLKHQKIDTLRIIIIMNNALKANKNLEQALEQAISRTENKTKIELKKAKQDLEKGLTIGEAFLRIYTRTNCKKIKRISETLTAVQISGANIINAFASLEEEFTKQEICKNECHNIKKINSLITIILSILPILILYTIKKINSFWNQQITRPHHILIFSLIIMYIIYIIILKVIGGNEND